MASLQPSWLSSLNTINSISSSAKPTSRNTPFKLSFSLNPSNAESSPNSQQTGPDSQLRPVDPVKLAFEKAKAYKKPVQLSSNMKTEQNPVEDSSGTVDNEDNGDKKVPVSVKVAMEKAKEYMKSKGVAGGMEIVVDSGTSSGFKQESISGLKNEIVEKKVGKKEEMTISSIDFVGLNFADKKKGRGLPAGLVPVVDTFPEGDLPEVEIIVGDTRNFEETTTSKPKPAQEDNWDLYKPKVSTWGVFPRPGNISKTFGGGKVIRPGDVLETAEDRAAKEERTRQLIANYKKQVGLSIDAKLKSECEKALKDGDSIMDSGKLKEALPYYQKVMDKLPFKSELYGLAALQWSICQDSLTRPNEARIMYEKLQSHPNPKVSKKARQFMFSFQAMEMMKVTGSTLSTKNTGYQNYFEAFIEDKTNYSPQAAEDEGALSQALPYLILLVSPIFIVLFIAVQKGNIS